jgi:hypothetical protein
MVGEASRFASSVRAEQSETLRLPSCHSAARAYRSGDPNGASATIWTALAVAAIDRLQATKHFRERHPFSNLKLCLKATHWSRSTCFQVTLWSGLSFGKYLTTLSVQGSQP